ncbi:hypothetical protein [Leucobacter sp.]
MTTERTDHAAEALRVLQLPTSIEDATEANALAYAQVHATLALVEQQRIQNLIALCGSEVEVNMLGRSVSFLALGVQEKVGTPENGFIRRHLNPDIGAALGIEEVQS